MNYFVGMDLSFSSTGLFIVSDDLKEKKEVELVTETKDFENDIIRIDYISERLIEDISKYKEDIKLIVLEDYFSGRTINSQVGLRLASLGTIVRYKLLKEGYTILTVAPAQNKKFVTGLGNSNKDQIQMFVLKKFNHESISNNTADACGLAHLGRAYNNFINNNCEKFLKYEIEVLKKIKQDRILLKPYDLNNIVIKPKKKKINKEQ